MDTVRRFCISFLLISFTYVLTPDAQTCSIPAEWQGEFWTRYDSTNNRDIITEFSTDSIIIKDGTTDQVIETYQCDESSTPELSRDWNYIVRSPSPAGTPQTCLRARAGAEENLLVVWDTTSAVPDPLTAADCSDDDIYQEPAQLLVRVDATANNVDPECSLGQVQGKYQAVFDSASCDGDDDSAVVISSENITINTCYSGTVDYANPLSGVTLKCVSRVFDNDLYLGGSGLGNNIVVLSSDTLVNGRTVYYCARLEVRTIAEPLPGTVYMSLDVTDSDTLDCTLTQTSTSSGVQDGSTFVALKLAPNDCEPNPCLNGGTCQQNIGSFDCLCPEGFSGDLCDSELFCFSEPCQSGATCDEDNDDCVCAGGFTGQACETELLCVTSNPCNMNNTETCVEPDATCECKPGFSGLTCDEELMCTPNPCLNDGTCDETTAVCNCVDGFTGSLCETTLFCMPDDPCANGGTCNEAEDTCDCPAGFAPPTCDDETTECLDGQCNTGECVNGTCVCPEGTFGTFCDGDDPCDPNPCFNGTCTASTDGSPLCACADGSTGTSCPESGASSGDGGFDETVFIAVMSGVGGLLFLALLVCLLCYCARSEGPRKRAGSKERLAYPPPQPFPQPLAYAPSVAAAPSIIMAGSYVPTTMQTPMSTLRPPVRESYSSMPAMFYDEGYDATMNFE